MDHLYDIFLSYRREDGAEFCEGLSNILMQQGFSVFFDKKSLRSGSDFPQEIEDAVRNCNEFIIISTKSYFGLNKNNEYRILNDGDWCAKELEIALNDNRKNIFPILIDTQPPQKNKLPIKLHNILNKNFTVYDRTIDTYEKIVEKIKPYFNQKTIENAIVGHITSKLSEVDAKDLKQFNVACKEIIKLLNNENDETALKHILFTKTDSNYLYDNDKRFIVFYTLFSYYRRIRQIVKMIALIENIENEFDEYPFIDYVKVEYCTNKFLLSDNKAENKQLLIEALEYSKSAIKKINDNNGIIHSYCMTIAICLENNIKIIQSDLDLALKYIDCIIENDRNYALYYATKARLLAQINDYDNALNNIQIAETLETASAKDWTLRISNYNKIETLILIKKYIMSSS